MILVVDNYDSFTYNLLQILEELSIEPFEVVKNDCIPFPALFRFKKILLSPGPGIPSDSNGLMKIIQTCKGTHSILGICLGHQAIAEAFGAKLVNLSEVIHGVNERVSIINREEYLFRGLPESIDVGLYHSWCVEKESIPKDITITALSERGVVMGISHREYDIRGVQFHPESIMTPFGTQIIRNWILGSSLPGEKTEKEKS